MLLICHGTFLPSSGVMVDWISALVSLDVSILSTCVTVASLTDDSMYFVFICALILYLWKNSLSATAYGRSRYRQGAGGAVGGTVDKQMLPGFIPTFSENIELSAC